MSIMSPDTSFSSNSSPDFVLRMNIIPLPLTSPYPLPDIVVTSRSGLDITVLMA